MSRTCSFVFYMHSTRWFTHDTVIVHIYCGRGSSRSMTGDMVTLALTWDVYETPGSYNIGMFYSTVILSLNIQCHSIELLV